MGTQEIPASRWKHAIFLAISLGFVGIAFLPGMERDLMLWFCAGFFGLCVLIFLAQIVSPPMLQLNQTGFEYRPAFGKAWSLAWREIETLGLWNYKGKKIAWNLRPEFRKDSLVAQASRAMGMDGTLPGNWSMKPERLLDLMRRYHATYGR